MFWVLWAKYGNDCMGVGHWVHFESGGCRVGDGDGSIKGIRGC